MSEPRFIHLRVHSAYSLLEGAMHVKTLPARAAAMDMPAIGITDRNNLFGALEFSEAAAKAGVQPVMGLQLALSYVEPAPGQRAPEPAPIALYAKDEAGWLNLMALSSAAFLDTDAGALPQVPPEALEAHSDGVICLTGGADGPLARLILANRAAEAQALAERLRDAFPDRLYVEIGRHGAGDALRTAAEAASEPGLIELAHGLELPLVA
ncbi:MAG TPA: PHP domain-containing protein, partial [Thermohalobaculum sp.]|nr:PHP domain-containing protein [Thermohalobaculum sp.]